MWDVLRICIDFCRMLGALWYFGGFFEDLYIFCEMLRVLWYFGNKMLLYMQLCQPRKTGSYTENLILTYFYHLTGPGKNTTTQHLHNEVRLAYYHLPNNYSIKRLHIKPFRNLPEIWSKILFFIFIFR